MVVADLSNMAVFRMSVGGIHKSKTEATGVKIHPTPFRLSTGCLSSRSNKLLVLNMNETFSTMHPSKALHFFHSVPYDSEAVSMMFGGVKNPSGLQEKQISIKAREVSMVRQNSNLEVEFCNSAGGYVRIRNTVR